MAASSSSSSVNNSDDIVLLEVRSPDPPHHSQDNITPLSAWELHDSLDLNLTQGIIKIRVHRSRLMEHSTYFRSIFGGSFKESLLDNVNIQWELATFVAIMRLIYGVPVNISFINFLPLLEGALFFGVEDVIIKCEKWSLHTLSKKMKFSEGTLQQLINIWNFGADNGICFILEIYTLCFAVNFGGILRDASFATLSYALLNTCINHPLLTVDSEGQLCEALLDWLAINNQCSKLISCNTPNTYFQILEKVRICLLPLEFILGRLWRDYPKMVASLQRMTIFYQISSNDHSDIQDGELDMFRLRLTQYSEVSGEALSHIIVRNPGLKILKARGCKRMAKCFYHVQVHDPSSFHQNGELIQSMGRLLNLQELAVGWGLSGFSVAMMKPALASLRCLTVGLGGSLGTQLWLMLPEICPLLEHISVCFQTVSDEGVLHVLKNLRYMHTLELQHCFGELSSKILSVSVSNLKSLRLDRVAPWMTDENLDMLSRNLRSLSQLSLAGCTLLTPDAQHIIASGWPGLTNIRLEDCFKVTANGVSSLLDCKSVEDLVLRHNGSGIRRNFVMEAALKFPLLRTLSLDLCDACESGFDTPLYLDRFSLCMVKLARCKLQKCALEIKDFRMGPKSLQPHCVHKETICLEWTSTDLKTTVVAERI